MPGIQVMLVRKDAGHLAIFKALISSPEPFVLIPMGIPTSVTLIWAFCGSGLCGNKMLNYNKYAGLIGWDNKVKAIIR